MVFIYYSQGVSSQYQDFTERLVSHLALKGTEITQQVLKETTAQMHVKHTDEQGHLDIAVDNKNVRITYTVDREHKEISKGIMGAIAGAGIGGVLGNILRKDQSAGDAITGAIGGAAAGGAGRDHREGSPAPPVERAALRRQGRSRHARRRPGVAGRPPGARLARQRRDAVEGGLGDEDGGAERSRARPWDTRVKLAVRTGPWRE